MEQIISQTGHIEKRILIISNACFSDSDSNGRTLSKLFQSYNKDFLAQFFVYGSPNFDICNKFYHVSDFDAFKSFIKFRAFGAPVNNLQKEVLAEINKTNLTNKKIKKTPLSLLLREFVWLSERWKSQKFSQWIDEFQPEKIFLSLGDNIFLCRLAVQISKKYNIPIYLYSTENYFLKKYNYLTNRPSLFYKIFYFWLNRVLKDLEKYVRVGIFNTPLLMEAYASKFNYPCECVYSKSDIAFINNSGVVKKPIISYLGNLGVGRHKALVELANILGEVVPDAYLYIYGNLPKDKQAVQLIKNCKNIRFCGFVSYTDVVRIIHESNLLVHAELDNEFYSKDLKFAFSTKITDSVCSGTPFLIYARHDLAETIFLKQNKCAFVSNNIESLREVLLKALFDKNERIQVVDNAKKVKDLILSTTNNFRDIINK